MMKIEPLTALKNGSNSAILRMENLIKGLNNLIAKLESDSSRSQGFIKEAVQAERDKILPALSAELATIRKAAEAAAPHQRYYESRVLLLSLTTFDSDAARDAQIKMSWRQELENMPPALLQLFWESTYFDANLPLLWQIFCTGQRKATGNAGITAVVDMSIDTLVIPTQAQGLASIAQIKSNVGHGESMASGAMAMNGDVIRKLTVAREMAQTARMVANAEMLSD